MSKARDILEEFAMKSLQQNPNISLDVIVNQLEEDLLQEAVQVLVQTHEEEHLNGGYVPVKKIKEYFNG